MYLDKYKSNYTELEKAVFDIAWDNIEGYNNSEEVRNYLENEATCNNGSVLGMIYHSELEPFARGYHVEILEILQEYYHSPKESHITIPSELLLASKQAQFAFEYLLLRLIDDLVDKWIKLKKKR